jgi:hypothetical protein
MSKITKYRINNCIDIATEKEYFLIQGRVPDADSKTGFKWMNLMDDEKAFLYESEEEAHIKLKELNKKLKEDKKTERVVRID